jgi:hypothetical protein
MQTTSTNRSIKTDDSVTCSFPIAVDNILAANIPCYYALSGSLQSLKPAWTIQTHKTKHLAIDMTHILGVVTSITAGPLPPLSNWRRRAIYATKRCGSVNLRKLTRTKCQSQAFKHSIVKIFKVEFKYMHKEICHADVIFWFARITKICNEMC